MHAPSTSRISAQLLSTLLLTARLTSADVTSAPPSLGYFSINVIDQRSYGGASYVSLNANGNHFFIDKPTNATCADGSSSTSTGSSCCTANQQTSYLVSANSFAPENSTGTPSNSSGPTSLFLNTAGYASGAKQQVYCQSGTGALAYTPAGELLPTDTADNAKTVSYEPQTPQSIYGRLKLEAGGGILLCETDDGYVQAFCSTYYPEPAPARCNSSELATRFDFAGIAAGQYI